MSRLTNSLALALSLFVSAQSFAAVKTIYDFGTLGANAADWQVVNDGVMGGISTSAFVITNGVAVFRGSVSLENNGGFASVRSVARQHDTVGSTSFIIRVKGDGHRYKFTARTEPGMNSPIYQAVFTTKEGQWAEVELPMKDFVPSLRGRVLPGEPPLNSSRIVSVGFLISDNQAGPFRLEVQWIKAATP